MSTGPLPAGPLYFVKRLAFDRGKVASFDSHSLACQFFPASIKHANLIVTTAKAPFAASGFERIMANGTQKVTAIDYVLAAVEPDSECLVMQAYRHPFKRDVRLTGGRLVAFKGPLFQTHPLNFLLNTKKFGGLIGVQFAD